ncbi:MULTISPECIES: hypothetical protein [unclassified Mesorhizobium]|uniref:hypothetical protein n=1 Tax=unclassified Mesorhizobium TaxID=325217 RepID=UPI000BB020B8|nr:MULTISPECIES: hypothetical protein [unclassified Mesorhizobium]MBZ9885692.1 hypothetical protein [Mesorhizobium sp. CA10]PBB21814.1 hypothetical protein CK219_04445 [Mesorhizobium sp. WSM4313]
MEGTPFQGLFISEDGLSSRRGACRPGSRTGTAGCSHFSGDIFLALVNNDGNRTPALPHAKMVAALKSRA